MLVELAVHCSMTKSAGSCWHVAMLARMQRQQAGQEECCLACCSTLRSGSLAGCGQLVVAKLVVATVAGLQKVAGLRWLCTSLLMAYWSDDSARHFKVS